MSFAAKKSVEQTADQTRTPYRFSVHQYHRMVETGILTVNDRTELLEGLIINKMPHNPRHDGTIQVIQRRLWVRLPDDWLLRIQSAVTLGDSEPEPDLAIVRGPEKIYFQRHPLPRDIALLIEVSEASLAQDREQKLQLYARHRIPTYWIVNLKEGKLEVYTVPRAGRVPGYRQREDFARNESVPLVLAGREIARLPVHDLLPPEDIRLKA
jgi:Uma2 family endonuclease